MPPPARRVRALLMPAMAAAAIAVSGPAALAAAPPASASGPAVTAGAPGPESGPRAALT